MSDPWSERPWVYASVLARHAGVSGDTVVGWIRDGVLTADGIERVKLVAERVGGRWRVQRADWEAFQAACRLQAESTVRRPGRRLKAASNAPAGWDHGGD